MSQYNDYLRLLGDPHENVNDICSIKKMDFELREAIGKTEDISVSLCSHQAILAREYPEHFCRICNKDLSVVTPRWNDYLVLRHPLCRKPICFECAKNNPDEFHKAFQRGIKELMSLR